MGEGKKFLLVDNLTTKDRVILCLSEVTATAILVYLGCMGCVVSMYGTPVPHEQICLTFGLAVMVAVQVFGHISGAHINPIVTVAAAALGNISLIQVVVYFVGQMIGALLGFGLLMVSTPSHLMGNQLINTTEGIVKTLGVCSPAVSDKISPLQGLLVEFLISLILVLVCCGVWDSRNSDKHDSVSIRLGLAIAVLALAGGPYTGANMNPARSFAPALFNGDWENHWLYWVGPLSAGLIGGLFYRFVFTKETPPSSKETLQEEIPLNKKV